MSYFISVWPIDVGFIEHDGGREARQAVSEATISEMANRGCDPAGAPHVVLVTRERLLRHRIGSQTVLPTPHSDTIQYLVVLTAVRRQQ